MSQKSTTAGPTDEKPRSQREPLRGMSIDSLGATPEETRQISIGPKAFMHAWFQLFRTAQIHSADNVVLQRPIQNFIDVVETVLKRDGIVSFQSKDGTLFLNSVNLSLSNEEYELADSIFQFFEDREIGGFQIDSPLNNEHVLQLLDVLVYAPRRELRLSAIETKLRSSQIPFRVNRTLGLSQLAGPGTDLERRTYTFLTYSKLIVLSRALRVLDSANRARRNFLIKKIARTVQALIDICIEDDHTFLGIAAVKSSDAYAATHSANVVVLSIALGEKIGLSKVDLEDLGLAAFFCDIGLLEVPEEVLSQKRELDHQEIAVMQRHTLRGAEFMLRDAVLSKSLLRAILVAFEHHRRFDGGGYPHLTRAPDLFSRIVAIADAYDALTSDRPWRRAYLPDEALGLILKDAGKQFDPGLTKVFVNTLGLYPVGALVRLDNGKLAVVVYGGGEGERVTRPIIAVLGPDFLPGRAIDLTAKGASGEYLHDIVACENPAKYGLQPSGLLASTQPL